MKAVVALGACAVDTLIRVPRLPNPDEMVFAQAGPVRKPGGSTANIAVGLARLGLPARFVGKMGDDPNGRAMVADLELDSVDTRFVTLQPGERTAETFIAIDDAGNRVIFSLGGTALIDKAQELPAAALAGAAALYIGEAFPEIACQVAQSAHAAGLIVLYSPGGAFAGLGIKQLAGTISCSDYVLLSRTELRELTGCERGDSAVQALFAAGAHRVLLTLGAGGATLYENTSASRPGSIRQWHAQAYPVCAIDTTGAGDAFTAGFINGLVTGLDPERCLELGNACGAMAVMHTGAREGLPMWSEVEDFLVRHSSARSERS